MLHSSSKVAIYMEGHLFTDYGKMGHGVLRYLPNPIVAVIDSENVGKNIKDCLSIDNNVPVVKDIDAAIFNGAEVLILGIASSGGKIPKSWLPVIDTAILKGLSIINGLHDELAIKYKNSLSSNQWIWDVRIPQFTPNIAAARALKTNNKRILCVGTDMACGKMTTSLELYKWAKENKIKSSFIATGQIGITVTGKGIPLDAYKVDHACGAVEQMVLEESKSDWVFIEGQGSLLHPGSSATLPLMRGSCATHLILCHRANMTNLRPPAEHIKIPNLNKVIELNEALANACGTFSKTKVEVVGISLNTVGLDSDAAQKAIDFWEAETNLPVTDVIRFGPEKIALAIKNYK
ncbi:MAG: DUF1611 domain-containing protein [Bacteroidetes bacterium]|jgi:uncharacterized NAD-dependent epimerase/dehydratase family protein|nr:MAG: hypothetical protein ABR90_03800 [Cryomorphaceae bacterium BACL29 MAG-121220-bin8]MDA0757406.1 DUF1611 domain-containing protein [Bacteroidota bacterium]MDA1019838.1 DUF1611 domain-containing protein [Bacteroidota bacterium]|tara:strand:+ start:20208 stop:21254 length:1047 start_codon:yes stop_codon:yes gene_type:complete